MNNELTTGKFCMNLPFEIYQESIGINASCIAHGRKSMLHMHHAMTNKSPSTPAMIFGTQAHYAVLEGGKNLTCCDARRGSKEWDSAIFLANGDERMVMKSNEYESVCRMRDAVMANSDARWLIESTDHEVSAQWTGRYGFGKGRMDCLSSDCNILADYKTTGDITERAFYATAERLAYHVKMGWYAESVKTISGRDPNVYIIVQESKAPYDCWVCQIPASVINQGRDEAIEIAVKYHCCNQSGVFAGVNDGAGIVEYTRPSWVLGGENAEVNMEGVEV